MCSAIGLLNSRLMSDRCAVSLCLRVVDVSMVRVSVCVCAGVCYGGWLWLHWAEEPSRQCFTCVKC